MYKGTVLSYLRKYIKNLQADQLESYILAGECTLHAIELEPSAISDWISDVLPYTMEVQKVFCSKVDIKIPWAQIRTKPLVVAIQQMEITVLVHDFREQEWNSQVAAIQKNKLISNKISELNLKVTNFDKFLKQFELGWTDYVFSGCQIRIEFCKLNLVSRSISRLPPSALNHACKATQGFEQEPGDIDPDEPSKPAFTLELEGVFVAPCHYQQDDQGWTVSYVESPDKAYQYDSDQKLLRLSRLITLKTLSISARGERALLTHSPGFRMRLSSEYHTVNLSRSKQRFCIPPFPAKSNNAIWMDKVNFNTHCSCDLACFYAILQDLLAPVIVPAEALTPENRAQFHYSFDQEDVLKAENVEQLESYKIAIATSPIMRSISRIDSPDSAPSPIDKNLGSLSLSPTSSVRSSKKTNIVRGGKSAGTEFRRLFYGLAKEVKTNAEKVSEQAQNHTDKFVNQSKKFFKTAFIKKTSSESKPFPQIPQVDDSPKTGGPIGGQASPARSAARRSARSSFSEREDNFLDAVSEDDVSVSSSVLFKVPDDADTSPISGPPKKSGTKGYADGFGIWTEENPVGDSEYTVSQLVIVDKICFKSFFHFHINELNLFVHSYLEPSGGESGTAPKTPIHLTISIRQFDMSSDSQTPLPFSQLSTLAGFSQAPELFLSHARTLSANVLCPFEPVHAMTAITIVALQISATNPSVVHSPSSILVKFGSSNHHETMRSLSLKWKSRSPPPTRLIKANGNNPFTFEIGRIQPMEGCFHRLSVLGEGLTPIIDLYNQVMSFSGDFPDVSFDPEIRMRICVRDAELLVPSSDWRLSFPSGILLKNFKQNQRITGGGFAELLSGFQSLSTFPDCHWSRDGLVAASVAHKTETGDDSPSGRRSRKSDTAGFPYDGSFCSCICGQERTSWSWALPSAHDGQLPTRIMLPGRVLGNGGVVAERTWKRCQANENDQLVYLSATEYGGLLETKLKVAEQKVHLDQLREQYNTVMEEMTKRNIFLKEKWAEEAVQVGSKETVIDILTQKVGALEKLVRELTDAKELAEKSMLQMRTVSATELASARKELLEETQRLKYQIADTATIETSAIEQLKARDLEIEVLKKQRDFLLGMGVKSSVNSAIQTEDDSVSTIS